MSLFASFNVRASTDESLTFHEVTATEYCDFLNKNALIGPDHLFDQKISTDSEAACILRLGKPGKYFYKVIQGRENFPIYYLSKNNEELYATEIDDIISDNEKTSDPYLKSNQNQCAVFSSEKATLTLAASATVSQQSGSIFNQKNIVAASIVIGAAFLTHGMTEESDFSGFRTLSHDDRVIVADNVTASAHEIAQEKREEACGEKDSSSSMEGMDRISDRISPSVEPMKSDATLDQGMLRREGKLGITTIAEASRGSSPNSPTRFKSDAEEFFASSSEDVKKIEVVESDQKSKSVSFNVPDTETSQRERRKKSPEEKQLSRYGREFKTLISGIEIAIDDIPEDDPERENKIAAIDAAGDYRLKAFAETLRSFVRRNPNVQPEKVNNLIAAATIEAIQLDRYYKPFGKLIAGIETALKAIPKSDSESANEAAKIYSDAYPKLKNFVQEFRLLIANNVRFQTEKGANLLADATIKTIEAAFHLITSRGIKINVIPNVIGNDAIEKRGGKLISVQPYTNEDEQNLIRVYSANDVVENLEGVKKVFTATDSDARTRLKEAQENRAIRVNRIADMNQSVALAVKWSLMRKRNETEEWKHAFAEAEAAVAAKGKDEQECWDALQVIVASSPIADPVQAKQQAIADILSIVEKDLEAGDHLINMLTSREVN